MLINRPDKSMYIVKAIAKKIFLGQIFFLDHNNLLRDLIFGKILITFFNKFVGVLLKLFYFNQVSLEDIVHQNALFR